ncbi:DUF6551 family protein [Parasphingorhabdus sp.]|uniref:DUF6551 family protein n=1 Tax=Parasphingorhabdus sp. TaxID=2709688 RepID=UPI0035944952
MTRFNAPKGTPPAIQYVEVSTLKIVDHYQRSADTSRSQTLIKNIAEYWDWRLCVPLTVSQRSEGLYVLDGQHRLAAARMRGDIVHLPASVSLFSSIAEEALLFVQANANRKKFTPFDEFRARIAAGDHAAIEVRDLVEDAGLKIAPHSARVNWKPGEIGIFKAVERAVKLYGRPVVSAALTQMGEAFSYQKMTKCSPVFGGLCLAFFRPKHAVDPDELADILGIMECDEWAEHPFLEDQRSGAGRSEAMLKAILHEMSEVGQLNG